MESLVDAMTVWLESKMQDLHTAIPAKIEVYDEKTNTATVLPLLSKITIKNESVSFPSIAGVPIVFPSGKSFSLTWDVQKGDGVLLIFSEAALGSWVNSDGTKQLRPEGKHRFSETDAMAIPGLLPSGPDGKVKLHVDKSGNVTITGAASIKIGTGSSPFVKGDSLETFFNTLLSDAWLALPSVDPATNSAKLVALTAAATAAKAMVSTLKSTKVSAE